MGEIMLIAMSSTTVDPMTLRELADFTVRPQLLTVPGVAQVIPIGGEVRQYRVVPDPRRMASLDVSFEAIENAIKQFGANTGGGFVDLKAREVLIRNIGRTTKIEDLRNLVVAYREGHVVSLEPGSRCRFRCPYQARRRRIQRQTGRHPGRAEAARRRHRQHHPPDRVHAAGAATRRCPEGVRTTDIQFRQASFIETSIDNLLRVLLEALICVAIVLFVFLLNWQTTFISLVAIPLSVLSTLVVFQMMGLSINTMTLGGLAIAIGALVDDAVVDVENIYRRLGLHRAAAGRDRRSIQEVIAAAATEVQSGIVYATIIIVLVFLPVFALSGIEGRLFTPLGIAFIVSILASLVVSLTVTPVLCYWLLPRMRKLVRARHAARSRC